MKQRFASLRGAISRLKPALLFMAACALCAAAIFAVYGISVLARHLAEDGQPAYLRFLPVLLPAAAAAFVAIYLFKTEYLPWLLASTPGLGRRLILSLTVAGIVLLFALGQAYFALFAIGMWAIFAYKRRRERGKTEWQKFQEEMRREGTWAGWEEDGESPTGVGMTDPWETLGLSPGAGRREIKSAYRRICMDCHPDRNGGVGDGARFREATQAYRMLMEGLG